MLDSPGEAAAKPAPYLRGNPVRTELSQTNRATEQPDPKNRKKATHGSVAIVANGASPSEAAVWELDVCGDGGRGNSGGSCWGGMSCQQIHSLSMLMVLIVAGGEPSC